MALVAAMEREEDLVVFGPRGPDVEDSPAYGQLIGFAGDVALEEQHPLCADVGRPPLDHLDDRGVPLPHDHRGPGLHDPGLLLGDVGDGGAEVLDVVEPDRGQDGHLCIGQVRGIPTAAHADLDDDGVDGHVGEPSEGTGGDQLEPRHTPGEELLDALEHPQLVGQVGVGDRLVLPADVLAPAGAHGRAGDPFVDALEVRARRRPDRQPRCDQQRRQDACRRRLPVGAGDVEDGARRLRVARGVEEGPHALQAR